MREAQFKIVLTALLLADAGIRLYYQTGRKEFVRAVVKFERREKILYYLVSLGLIPIFFYVLTSWIDSFRLPFPAWLRWLVRDLSLLAIFYSSGLIEL